MKPRFALVIVLAAVLLSACGSTKIGRVLADPSRYANRSVTVEGNVSQVVGALNYGVYQVDDGTGKIYVVSTRGVPGKGARVKVSGPVQPGFSFMGKSLGAVIKARDHDVKF